MQWIYLKGYKWGWPSVSQNCWPTRWISLCLHWEHILGETKKIFWCTDPPRGGGAGLVRYYHQNKTAPEPLAAPEPLVLQNKTAPEPPEPYFGGSTSKKTAPEPPLPYFGGSTSKKTAPEPPLPILLLVSLMMGVRWHSRSGFPLWLAM